MGMPRFLAVDIGASGGRCLLGTLTGGSLVMEEISRFPNNMVAVTGGLHWDLLALYDSVVSGILHCCRDRKLRPDSIGIDTWGVDFGLLAADGSVLGFPRAYRDPRNLAAMDSFLERIPRDRLYQLTGIQIIFFNTVFQLWAMARERSPLLSCASDLLFTPDLLNYLLCGIKKAEFTIASTSQLLEANSRDWSRELFDALGVAPDIMQELVEPGTVIGEIAGNALAQLGLAGIPVVATASHDTASAVAAVPAEGDDWAYLSSGTWSLMGMESDRPIINAETRTHNFTNEGGVAGAYRVLKNIAGLWLLQECRRSWAKEKEYSYVELVQAARAASGFASLLDCDAPEFASPTDMVEAIQLHCERTQQAVPREVGEFTRAILVSLALKYRFVLNQLRQLSPRPINRLHVVGGGVQNEMLCQFTADATGLPVVAGPVEATATGNLLVQAMATGHLTSLAEARAIVRASSHITRYEPSNEAEWSRAYERFVEVHGIPEV